MASKLAALLVLAVQLGATLALPPCVCTLEKHPLCGSDGHTYSNHCHLDCQRILHRELTIVREGPCEAADTPACICTLEYKPVCGTDGITYSNNCSFGCQRSSAPDLEVKHQGKC